MQSVPNIGMSVGRGGQGEAVWRRTANDLAYAKEGTAGGVRSSIRPWMDVGLGNVVAIGVLGWGGGGLRHPKAEKEVVFALGRGRWSESSVIVVHCASSPLLFVGMGVGKRDGG